MTDLYKVVCKSRQSQHTQRTNVVTDRGGLYDSINLFGTLITTRSDTAQEKQTVVQANSKHWLLT